MPATLSKEERLSGKSAIAALLSGGKWGHFGHFKYCVLKRDDESPNRILVSVPKKNFRRAVKRNLLKRRIREAYRTQKSLMQEKGRDVLFFYNSTQVSEYAAIRVEIASILSKI